MSGPPLDLLVVGAGGIGGHQAGILARGGLRVGVVARGDHGAAIAERGLTVIDPQIEERAAVEVDVSPTLAAAPPAAAVALATKAGDLAGLVEDLAGYLGRCPAGTPVVTWQNGVAHLDASAPLARALPDRLVAGSVYIFSHIEGPAVIRVVGGPRLYRMGPWDAGLPALARATEGMAEAWRAAGLSVDAGPDGRRVAWDKLCILACIAGLTSVTGRTVGELLADDEMAETLAGMCGELVAVANADGVPVDAGLPQFFLATLRGTDPQGRSSLHLDLTGGRRGEIDVLLADPLARAARHGVATPILRTVLATTRVRFGLPSAP